MLQPHLVQTLSNNSVHALQVTTKRRGQCGGLPGKRVFDLQAVYGHRQRCDNVYNNLLAQNAIKTHKFVF